MNHLLPAAAAAIACSLALGPGCLRPSDPDPVDVPRLSVDDTPVIDDDLAAQVPQLLDVHPDDGSTTQLVRDALWADFEFAAPDPAIVLEDADGQLVAGAASWLTETRFAFVPSAPLRSGSHYVASATWGVPGLAEEFTWEFDTSVQNDPAGDPEVGDTYSIDLATGNVISPEGGQSILESLRLVLLHSVRSATGSEADFLSAMAERGSTPPVQDLCNPSMDLDEAQPSSWNDPQFHSGPSDVHQAVVMPFLGRKIVTFQELEVWGEFAASTPTGPVDQMIDTSFKTVVDVRELGLACSALRILFPEARCSTCPRDADSSECLVFYVTGLAAEVVSGLATVEWAEADVQSNPECPL